MNEANPTSSVLETTDRLTCLSAGKTPENETVKSEKRGLQREELNWARAPQTLTHPAHVMQKQYSVNRSAPGSLADLIPCLLMERLTRSPVP